MLSMTKLLWLAPKYSFIEQTWLHPPLSRPLLSLDIMKALKDFTKCACLCNQLLKTRRRVVLCILWRSNVNIMHVTGHQTSNNGAATIFLKVVRVAITEPRFSRLSIHESDAF